MSDLERLQAYHVNERAVEFNMEALLARLAALEAQVAELMRRLDEQDGGK